MLQKTDVGVLALVDDNGSFEPSQKRRDHAQSHAEINHPPAITRGQRLFALRLTVSIRMHMQGGWQQTQRHFIVNFTETPACRAIASIALFCSIIRVVMLPCS